MTRWCRRWIVWLIILGGLTAFAAATNEGLRNAVRWLDVGEQPRPSDCVFVLGGGVEARPLAAAALVRCGLAKKVLVAHVAPPVEARDGISPPEHELAIRVLVMRGVRREDIVVLGHNVLSTYDEARALGDYLQTSPNAHVIVPTHEFHTRRTRWILSQVLGDRVRQVSLFSIPSEDFRPEIWWETEEGFITVTSEILKLTFYWFRYGRAWYLAGLAVAMLVSLVFYWMRRSRRKNRPSEERGPTTEEPCGHVGLPQPVAVARS